VEKGDLQCGRADIKHYAELLDWTLPASATHHGLDGNIQTAELDWGPGIVVVRIHMERHSIRVASTELRGSVAPQRSTTNTSKTEGLLLMRDYSIRQDQRDERHDKKPDYPA